MKKEKRQELIKQLIKEFNIATQEELVAQLREHGCEIGQATVSRDIHDLELVKAVIPGSPVPVYIAKTEEIVAEPAIEEERTIITPEENSYMDRIKNVFRESVISVESAYFLIIVKTLPGMAQAAAHMIDILDLEEVAGTIAGDDTIFIAVKEQQFVQKIIGQFKELMT